MIHIHPNAYHDALPEQRQKVRYDTTERDPEEGRIRFQEIADDGRPVWIVRIEPAQQPTFLRRVTAEELSDFSRLLPGMTAYAVFVDMGDHLTRVLVSPVPLRSSVPVPPPFWVRPPPEVKVPPIDRKGKRRA